MPQDSHRLGPGSLRRRARSNRKGLTGSGIQRPYIQNSHHLYGRASCHLEDDLRRPGAGPKVRNNSRAKEPTVKTEIQWCPSHQGIEGDEVADQ